MKTLHAVVGASGCGRGILPLVRDAVVAGGGCTDDVVFVDDGIPPGAVNGQRLLSRSQFLEADVDRRWAVIGIANSRIRERVADDLAAQGVGFGRAQASNVVIMDDVEIGEGACLSPFVTVTSNIRIGRHFHANLYSYVEHDCRIGDFVTFAPGVKCNGNIVIEDHVYIGAGAVIKQGVPGDPLVIGAGAIVGMGAVVTRSVTAGTTVVGNPARSMAR